MGVELMTGTGLKSRLIFCRTSSAISWAQRGVMYSWMNFKTVGKSLIAADCKEFMAASRT